MPIKKISSSSLKLYSQTLPKLRLILLYFPSQNQGEGPHSFQNHMNLFDANCLLAKKVQKSEQKQYFYFFVFLVYGVTWADLRKNDIFLAWKIFNMTQSSNFCANYCIFLYLTIYQQKNWITRNIFKISSKNVFEVPLASGGRGVSKHSHGSLYVNKCDFSVFSHG